MRWNAPAAVAILLFGELMAVGCSHLWEELEPLPGGTSTASTTTSGSGASSTASGTGGATSTASSTASTGGAGGSSSTASSSSGGTGGATGVTTVTYKATFAGCNSDTNLVLQDCESLVGDGGIMNIDNETSSTPPKITRGFVRFDLDGVLAGKTIDSVHLRLVTADVSNAGSDKSGAIWEVAPFTEASLATGQPAELGMAAVGLDLGPVVASHEYIWKLPATLVAANKPVFLGIRAASKDGVDYWNDHGKDPPRLVVDYH